MKKTNLLLVLSLALLVGMASCKKEGCTDPSASNYNPSATEDDGSCVTGGDTTATNPPTTPTFTPNFNGTFGALIAIKSVSTTSTPIGDIDTEIGTAVAMFSNDGGANYQLAGTVDVDGNALNVQSNNSYVYQITSSSPTGIDYGSSVTWTADGGTWPAFTATTNQDFASVSAIQSGNPNTTSSYSLSTSSVSNADSVLFVVAGQNGQISQMMPGTATSHTFSDSQISSIGTGSAIVQIVGLKYDLQNISSNDYYLINETVRSKTVTIE